MSRCEHRTVLLVEESIEGVGGSGVGLRRDPSDLGHSGTHTGTEVGDDLK